jgi:predicted nucleic acid-binding protein
VEDHPKYARVLEPVFAAANDGTRTLVTSAVTLLEVVVVPYRRGDAPLARRYERALTHGRGLRLAPLDLPLLRAAASLRAEHGIRTPDAIQLATGLLHNCVAFITNDERIPDVGMRVITLRE